MAESISAHRGFDAPIIIHFRSGGNKARAGGETGR